MRKWKRVDTADGLRFATTMDPHEVALLRNMASSMQEMLDERQSLSPSDPLEQLTGIRTGNTTPPANDSLRRLLPDFISAESAASDPSGSNGALRSLHEPQIIDAKISVAQRLLDTLPGDDGRVELSEDDANAWIAALNDVRLTLGTILDIGPDTPDHLPDEHPMAQHLDVYHWLTFLQECLVLGLMGKPIR